MFPIFDGLKSVLYDGSSAIHSLCKYLRFHRTVDLLLHELRNHTSRQFSLLFVPII